MKKMAIYWREWRGFFLFVLLMVVFRSAVADWYQVPTGSMKPTIIEGDRIFVNKLAYDLRIPFTLHSLVSWGQPQRGEIVVFDSPVEAQRLVKRVVGLPGDVIEVRDNQLFINGEVSQYQPVNQSELLRYWDITRETPVFYQENMPGKPHLITLKPFEFSPYRNFGPVTVPDEHYFMLGDNRDNSADSRFIGSVDRKYILGRAKGVVFSLRQSDRFFISFN